MKAATRQRNLSLMAYQRTLRLAGIITVLVGGRAELYWSEAHPPGELCCCAGRHHRFVPSVGPWPFIAGALRAEARTP